ncbi:hypothetical protein EJ05DRAFT_513758 [Pseudovirgaria hyperparasitica]|uniref:Uncharacterized protein n=1 Tax=Pseudovirgaria hyperparasitica TaxID=470096 RepID=A0A6A6VYT0_9PEZI|nr:uncharacterized protein EJ05DRAFT_513758 [Pseudovirgaria hyperparasitica]KAF2754840.1 hypothetical protein EJ05DRAFT_513758 [Pseudovirgaria hyperparasitica]
MRITQGTKAIFLIINHCVAAHTPPVAIAPPHRVRGSPSNVPVLRTWQPPAQLEPGSLTTRADGNTCEKKKARCKKNKIRNPLDDTKCIRCPPKTKPDMTKTICIDENEQECDKNDRQCKIKRRIKEVAKEKLKQFWSDIKERFKRKMINKKPSWERMNIERQDKKNQKKLRRIASCLPLVALAFGTDEMIDLADGGFSEDYLDNLEQSALAIWPKDIEDWEVEKVFPDDESDIKSDDYVSPFMSLGDGIQMDTARRSVMAPTIKDAHLDVPAIVDDFEPVIDHADVTALSTTEQKRQNPILLIVMAFEAIASIIVNVVAKNAGNLAKIGGKLAGRKPNVAKPGQGKFSRKDQGVKAGEVAKSRNWKNCLRGQKPK